MRERGKANLGDKTILDALFPAADAFAAALDAGMSVEAAGRAMVRAAEDGRDAATPLRNKIGRAGWIGERTEGLVDPGCELCVVVLRALARA
jgi:dihydroxyacetone kinase